MLQLRRMETWVLETMSQPQDHHSYSSDGAPIALGLSSCPPWSVSQHDHFNSDGAWICLRPMTCSNTITIVFFVADTTRLSITSNASHAKYQLVIRRRYLWLRVDFADLKQNARKSQSSVYWVYRKCIYVQQTRWRRHRQISYHTHNFAHVFFEDNNDTCVTDSLNKICWFY